MGSQRRTDNADPTVKVRRYDVGGDLLSPVPRGSDGAMLYEGVPVREGILVYRQADGTERRELVTRKAVEDTVRTGVRAPVTLEHPEAGFVTADTAAELGVGDVDGVASVEEDALGGYARIKLAVRRKDALDAIATGATTQLSPGYDVELDETPGEHPVYGRFDASQVGRVVNHIALVARGRGGTKAALRTDSADAVQIGRAPIPSAAKRRTDSEVRMNPLLSVLLATLGVSRLDDEDAAIKSGTAAAKDLAASAAKRKDAEEAAATSAATMEEMKAENEKLKADMATLKADYDALKGKADAEAAAAVVAAEAAEKAELEKVADALDVRRDGLDLAGLRKALVLTRIDSVDGKSPDYLAGVLAIVRADAVKAPVDTRWDWSDADKTGGKRADGKAGDKPAFRDPYLDAADESRGVTPNPAGGAQ